MLAVERNHLPLDIFELRGRHRGQSLLQQAPFGCCQPGNVGQSPAATVTALAAQPVCTFSPDGLHAGVDFGVKLEQRFVSVHK
jgi:hypothetical protein